MKKPRRIILIFIIALFCIILTSSLTNPVYAQISPYNAGYNHGCSDARSGGHPYLNSHPTHTSTFMQGYYKGYSNCSSHGVGPTPGSWMLDVKLTNPPFGVRDVKVFVKGPFGYQVTKQINWQQQVNIQGAFGPIHVRFPIPGNVIPIGYQFRVCSYNLDAFLGDILGNCQYFTRSAVGNSISKRV